MAKETLGRNQVFPIYDGNGGSFFGLVLKKAAVDSVVMSLSDKISGDVLYKNNSLQVTMREYIVYNGVKYILVNPPTIVRNGIVSESSDTKGMTKYSFEFYHPMYQLSNLPFTDVAVTDDSKRYLSENKSFAWIGYPDDYIAKLNKNLENTQWICEKSAKFPTDKESMLSSVLSFDNSTIADALKVFYDMWDVPFVIDQIGEDEDAYEDGKRFKVVLGLPSNEIYSYVNGRNTGVPYVFRMGQGVGLKNNSRTPRNNKIVTRIAGYGSENNIPYGYPQIVWKGDPSWDYTINNDSTNPLSYPLYMGIVNGEYVKLIKHPFTRTHLMPSVFTTLVNKKVNPYAEGYDPDTEIIDYYDADGEEYPNKINPLAPSYESHAFEEIMPELGAYEILDARPVNSNLEIVTEWDDTMDDDGNYLQSYFQITIPKLQFDLYACASITQKMEINMRGGACIGCTFPVQVDWDVYKTNFYDADGNFAPEGEQRNYDLFPDSRNGSINVIVKKEYDTFGTLMPNRYQTPKSGDAFVILGISLPLSYIEDAEERLDDEMKSYMLLNNVYYFDYPLKFDEYFLANNTEILSQIRPNAIVRFMFADRELELYVRQLTIRFGDNVLPQYDITLTDNIDVVTNAIGSVRDNVDKLAALMALMKQGQGAAIREGAADKLSRIVDDEAHGLIGFIKGAWFGSRQWIIDHLGNANLNNATINGVLRAFNAYINNVRSSNYTGDGMLDTGWRITNAYEGSNSKATFDYLYIRKKALFEELEIRKLSHIGGDFALSPASGRAWRVEIYDGVGKLLGYDEYPVPYRLGGRVLALFSHNLANRFLSRKKRFSRTLTDEEKQNMRRVRVLMFSDDGTTKTMQNWTVGAQARCQSFNITAQMDYHGSGEDTDNPDVEFWTGKKVQNTYWWRLVSATGTATADDGTVHNYVEFLVNQPNERTHCDVGSDIPSVGDEFCQFGHRTRSELSNVIMIETARDDSPAIKFYHGINSWDLNGKRCINISPTLFEAKASMFRWITEYGTEGQTINRGLWIDIAVDGNNNRRCYYNDLVSHNGSVWRCIVANGFHKEDANGHWYTQQEIDAMSLEEQMELLDVANYTIQEPSSTSTDWELYVNAAVVPYIKLSDALVAVPCEKDGTATNALSKTITAKLMVTNLEAAISNILLDGADQFVYLSGHNIVVNVPKGTAVINKDYVVTVEGDVELPNQSGRQHYAATTSISLYGVNKGNDAYDVALSPSVWIFSQGTVEPYSMNIDGNRTGNSSTGISVTIEGRKQPYVITSVVPSHNTIEVNWDRNSGTDNRVWITKMPNTIESGHVDITIQYANGATITKRIQLYCNLLGTWKETVIGDTKTEIAERTQFDVCDETGKVIKTMNLGEFIRSSSQNTSKITADYYDQSGNKIISNYSTTEQTANMISQSVGRATEGMVTTSTFKQTADSFSLITSSQAEDISEEAADDMGDEIERKLSQTGIIIDGSNRKINIIGDNVDFNMSSGDDAQLKFDTKNNTYTVGGFTVNSGYLGSEWNSATDGVGIYKDGTIYACNTTSSYNGNALRTIGGVEMNGYINGGRYGMFSIARSNNSLNINVGNVYWPTDIHGNNINIGTDTRDGQVIIGSGDEKVEFKSHIQADGDVHVNYALKIKDPSHIGESDEEDKGLRVYYERNSTDYSWKLRMRVYDVSKIVSGRSNADIGEIYRDEEVLKIRTT